VPERTWIFYRMPARTARSHAYRKKLARIRRGRAGARSHLVFMTCFDSLAHPESGYDDPHQGESARDINDSIRDEGAGQ